MKTTGAIWNEYLDSWPKGQWYDDSDESINGESFERRPYPDEVIEFTFGVVYRNDDDQDGIPLVLHFKAWLKTRDCQTIVCRVPNANLAVFRKYLKTIKAKEVKS